MDALEKAEKSASDKITRVEKEIKVNFLSECSHNMEVNVVCPSFYLHNFLYFLHVTESE